MTVRIIADSSADRNQALDARSNIVHAPLTIQVAGHHYVDDARIDLAALRQDIQRSDLPAKTAGVTPQRFLEAAGEADEIYIVTISQQLSGTYSNALLAAREMEEAGRRVTVFDTASAASGTTAVALFLEQAVEAGKSREKICAETQAYIEGLRTWFVLDDLSTLSKAGRMPKMAGRIMSGLSIKLICRGNHGKIEINAPRRGMESALDSLAKKIHQDPVDFSKRTLYISHVHAPERARGLANRLEDVGFAGIEILEASGLVTVYANEGGIVIAY